MQKITTFFWFDSKAEEAINLYTSLFKNSRVESLVRYPENGPLPAGTVMTASFYLEGQHFLALNGGGGFKFTEAISLLVDCTTQEEVDELWEKLSEFGEKGQCGWLKDRFGVSWQIVPRVLGEMMSDPDPEKAGRVMTAMLQMTKLDIAALKAAYEG